ncbi:MAG: allantoicase, partial [Woeseia sp.]|nr:allantoicase [Woeseia sp.]
FDVNTRFFTGNYAPAASIDVCTSDADLPGEDAGWSSLLSRRDLKGDASNYFAVETETLATHLRLNIYPDGGVARLRIFGEVRPDESLFTPGETVDLISMRNGGRALCCSDEHYGSMHNMNLPDLGTYMGDGWETARRRGPGNDWAVFELGKPGVVEALEIDTAYFKGNYPDRAEVRAAMVTDSHDIAGQSENWPVILPESKLQMDESRTFSDLPEIGPVSHVRLNIFPDGGISRFRVRGKVS